MISRSRSRRFALQLIYQVFAVPELLSDLTDGHGDFDRVFTNFWENSGEAVDEEARLFVENRVRGVLKNRVAIEAAIQRHAEHWRIERMAPVDLGVLRLGVYELLYSDIPFNIVINEAVDLAKQFSTAEASGFVNGILDAVAKKKDDDRSAAQT